MAIMRNVCNLSNNEMANGNNINISESKYYNAAGIAVWLAENKKAF